LEAAIQGQGFLENDIHKQRQDLKELLESEKRDKRLLKDKYKEMEAMLAEAHEKHD
jgi:septation ring formation regulator EzrA